MIDGAETTAHPAGRPLDDEVDAGVVAAAMRGDRAAIRLLWERHRRWVAAVLIAHKPSFEDLDDLLQEVALTFVDKVSTVREAAHLQAWLRTVAVNAARAAGRSGRYRRMAELPSSDVVSGDAPIDGAIGAREELALMLERLRDLPAPYREPLLLRSLHGMRSRQIAAILDVPPATVDTRIARARRMLRGLEDANGSVAAADSDTDAGDERVVAGRRGAS